MRRRAHHASSAHASRHRARVGLVPRRESRHRRGHHPRRRDARNRTQSARRIRSGRGRARGHIARARGAQRAREAALGVAVGRPRAVDHAPAVLAVPRRSAPEPGAQGPRPRARPAVPWRRRRPSPQRVHRPAVAGDRRAAGGRVGRAVAPLPDPRHDVLAGQHRGMERGAARRSPPWPLRSSHQASCSTSQRRRPPWTASPTRCGHV